MIHFDDVTKNIKNIIQIGDKFLINKRVNTGLKHLNDSKAFIEYLNDMNNIYINMEKCNPNEKR